MATVKKQDDFDDEKHSGKRPNQKLKPYLVLQILMEHTDEEHVLCAAEIVDYLDEMGIYAERRSIYTDIDEINKALYMQEQGCTIQEAADYLSKPEYKEEAIIFPSFRFSLMLAIENTTFLSCVFNGFRALVHNLCTLCAHFSRHQKSKSLNKYKNTADFNEIRRYFWHAIRDSNP